MKRLIFLALLAIPIVTSAQITHDSLWAPMKYFVGSWVGEGEGQSGTGKYERSYQWALNGNFIQVRNRVAYAPQEKSPQGEIHALDALNDPPPRHKLHSDLQRI